MEFGNRGHTWDTVSDVLKSDHPGPFAIRYKIAGSPWCRYRIAKNELKSAAEEFIAQGAKYHLMEFSPMQPDEKIILQGEVQRDHRGLCLFASRDKTPMRKALLTAKQYFGAAAKSVLSWACDSASLDDLLLLTDRYENM